MGITPDGQAKLLYNDDDDDDDDVVVGVQLITWLIVMLIRTMVDHILCFVVIMMIWINDCVRYEQWCNHCNVLSYLLRFS